MAKLEYCESCLVVPVSVAPSYCEKCLEEIVNDMAFMWDKVDDNYLAQLEITEENLNYGRLNS